MPARARGIFASGKGAWHSGEPNQLNRSERCHEPSLLGGNVSAKSGVQNCTGVRWACQPHGGGPSMSGNGGRSPLRVF